MFTIFIYRTLKQLSNVDDDTKLAFTIFASVLDLIGFVAVLIFTYNLIELAWGCNVYSNFIMGLT